tara:strand:+ start:653 stop:853 length:201 start_codon:yes stop_codon:yes gene_type:complete
MSKSLESSKQTISDNKDILEDFETMSKSEKDFKKPKLLDGRSYRNKLTDNITIKSNIKPDTNKPNN